MVNQWFIHVESLGQSYYRYIFHALRFAKDVRCVLRHAMKRNVNMEMFSGHRKSNKTKAHRAEEPNWQRCLIAYEARYNSRVAKKKWRVCFQITMADSFTPIINTNYRFSFGRVWTGSFLRCSKNSYGWGVKKAAIYQAERGAEYSKGFVYLFTQSSLQRSKFDGWDWVMLGSVIMRARNSE